MPDQDQGPVVPGERSITPLTARSGTQTKRIIGVAALLAAGSALIYLTLTGAEKKAAEPPGRPPATQETIDFKPASAPDRTAVPLNAQPVNRKPPPLPTELANKQHEQEQPKNSPKDEAAAAYKEGVEAPLFAAGGVQVAIPVPALEKFTAPVADDQTPLAAHLKATQLSGAAASVLPDANYLITAGTHIPCVLQTAMDSTVPGLTRCEVPTDVLSDNGRVVLFDKGTRIIGQYQADLKQGQQRIFVLWTRAETPEHVIIELGSPATDALGRAGFSGEVDTHFWARFGGALLLSVIDDGLQTLSAAQQKSGSTINETNTQSATQSSASTALQGSINIPPTLVKNQGEEVAVMVARDLDFHGVYKLRKSEEE